MADLKDLPKFVDDILPSVKALFSAAAIGGSAVPAATSSLEALKSLQKLISQSGVPTPATNSETAAAVTMVRGVLLDVLGQAAASNVALASTDVNTINVLFTALEDRAGRLLEMAAFASIPQLISRDALVAISANVQQAEAEIRSRQQAKEILDAVVKTVIVAAQIAAKLAV
jgi:predicted nucleic acid-binding protein